MKYLLVVVLAISVAFAVFALIFRGPDRDASVTLAELIPSEQYTKNRGNLEFAQTSAGNTLASLEIDSIFFALLSVCGALIALRIVVSSVRILREERRLARQQTLRSGVDSPRPVPVDLPDGTQPEPEQRAHSSVGAKRVAAGLREHLAYFTHGLTGKMIISFSGIVAAFGLLTVVLVHDHRGVSQRTLSLDDAVVYEIAVPVLEGRDGTVRVGIWREYIDGEINETVIPLLRLLAFVMAGGILAAVFLAWRINRPIFRLVAAAQAISRGDLDTPSPHVGDASEFGELSRAVERMRSSVKAALIRLSR